MTMQAPPDPILARSAPALRRNIRRELERAVLFGSRARGMRRLIPITTLPCFCATMPDRFAELNRLADLSTDILYEPAGSFMAMPYQAKTYNDARMPLMARNRAEGSICEAPDRRVS